MLGKLALTSLVVFIASASSSADAQSTARCTPTPGYLVFADENVTPARCGQVSGNNPDWAALPGRNWRNKADIFWNRGRTDNVCVYSGTSYTGTPIYIALGGAFRAANFGRSNKWIGRSTSCPRR